MNRGQLGALNYEIGRNQPMPQAAPQEQPMVNSTALLPQLEQDPLAIRGKYTDDYYNNYALLKNYVTDAQSKGINVFEPDYSQPGGGLPFQTFQKLQAGLMIAANKLKTEFQKEQTFDQYRYQNKAGYAQGFDPTQEFMVDDPNATVSYEPTYAVEAANRALGQNTYDRASQNRVNRAILDPAEADINAQIARGEISPQQGAINKAMLQANVYTNPIPREGSGSAASKAPALELAKAIVNQAAGAWVPGTYDETFVKGKRYLRSTKFNDVVGKDQVKKKDGTTKDVTVQVKEWLKDPQTGQVIVRFTDPDIPDQNLTPQEAEQFMVGIISNNPKYGGSTEIPKLYNAAKQLGWLDQTNTFRPEAVIDRPDLIPQGTGRTMTDDVLDRETAKVRKKLANTDDSIASFAIQGKTPVRIDKDEKGYYLYNFNQFLNPATGKPYVGKDKPRFQTEDDIVDFLNDSGYFDIIKEASYSGKPSQGGAKTASTTIDW